MSRLTKPDDTADPANTPEAKPAPDAPTAPPATEAPTAAPQDLHEPYPGAHFFHGGRHSPIVHAMARRLVQEGHWPTAQPAGPDWTNGHKRAFAAYQHTLRPKEGGDVSGIPDQVAWDRLQVPRVSPAPTRES
ncbi:peptidoglycan-binding protein [Streptomyces sp. ME02-6979.5a]|uniref:peptidoglycan-binding protein n=1 Tax=Streptomyces sp. ME02-6979.5a TaxID=462925 RepID=UPI0029B29AA3|nr:peptidoglycan-binding protein [Streptomyces sp. ME02-6979.5a]MDX3343494.1 peptidoglycan-binding protein [Streptomyces sp. ME02-6979.5a]